MPEHEQQHTPTADIAISIERDQWVAFLQEESDRLDQLGVRAGLVTVTVCDDDIPDADADVQATRAIRLLQHSISSTSRSTRTSRRSLSILVAPLPNLAALDRTAQLLSSRLSVAGFDATVGFAHRRVDEALIDTWARADAEADRARFRLRNPGGGLRLR
ncbi:MAG: hypothetical protein ACR2P0_13320 [Acidimicrobiales bacterium]